MKRETARPLSEPQQRHIATTLAGLEKHLAELRERLEHGPRDLRLTRYEDHLHPSESASLLPAIRVAEAHLREIADALQLPVSVEPVRRTHGVALELDVNHLYECLPGHGLDGYGPITPTTAVYLEREIPKLEAAVRAVIHQLLQAAQTNQAGPQ